MGATKKVNKAITFVLHCINESGADGYQTWDGVDENTPDEIAADGNALLLRFGGETYKATFRRITRD